MPTLQFQPTLRTIGEILGSDFYFIPRFQRPFAWEGENISDFWSDAVEENDEGYFIGPMVAYEETRGKNGIVDGQQRLTTTMLAICALRDMFVELGENELKEGISPYIQRRDINNRGHFVLNTEAAKEYFQSQILADPPREPRSPKIRAERELLKASNLLRGKIRESIADLDTEPRGEEPSPAVARLMAIRDRILALKVIWIRLDSEDDAYVIFETLNSRGKDLEVVDLLKNLLLQRVQPNNAELDEAKSGWNEMRTVLDTAGLNANTYILHWWLTRQPYTAERQLFSKIKKQMPSPVDRQEWASGLLNDLRDDAPYYVRVADPVNWDCKRHERGARASLIALGVFGVSQPRPMLLALMRSYERGEIKYKKFSSALAAIENFHYLSTAIAGISSTGGVSQMYALHARELTAARSEDARRATIDALIGKLKHSSRLPTREAFVSEFPRVLRISNTETLNKRLVQYTLQKLHDAARPGHALDHARCNIEHVSSQSHGEDYLAEIGNLLWIEESLNQRLGNHSYADKRTILVPAFQNTYDLNEIVASPAEWGKVQVEARSRRLAETAYDQVWAIN